MELDPVPERVVVHGARAGEPAAQRLQVLLPGAVQVVRSNRGERHEFDGLDLDERRTDGVPLARAKLRPTP